MRAAASAGRDTSARDRSFDESRPRDRATGMTTTRARAAKILLTRRDRRAGERTTEDAARRPEGAVRFRD
jgi:hypothetical protein